jgi:hypothetical protein
METAASILIDALGGTTAVARMTDAPVSTVHSWRKNGIPRSRLAHLRLLNQHRSDPLANFDKLSIGAEVQPKRVAA